MRLGQREARLARVDVAVIRPDQVDRPPRAVGQVWVPAQHFFRLWQVTAECPRLVHDARPPAVSIVVIKVTGLAVGRVRAVAVPVGVAGLGLVGLFIGPPCGEALDGSLDEINGFNRAQADDEQAKRVFLRAHPDLATVLFRLEDHPLLRGSLQAFDLDAATFARRAAAFESLMAAPDVWRDLTGALLASGNYARRRNDRDLQFGSPSNGEPWRNLLTGTSRANLRRTADALGKVLDAVAAGTSPRVSLRQMQDAFVASREATGEFDWRYYLVRYDTMREGASGIYASVDGNMGYLVCMLDKTQMNGRYRDPYLAALARQAGADAGLPGDAPVFAGGHVDYYRWMELPRSGAAVRCTLDGWVLQRPEREEFIERFDNVCAEFGVDEQLKLAVPQQVRDGRYVDASDRVQAGARLLRALAAAGL